MATPDDYRRAAGYRRSTAAGVAQAAPIGHNGGPRLHADWAYEPNPLSEGYVFEDMSDPRLAIFLGGGRQSAAGVFVSEHLALRNSTFFRAVNLISAAIGMLPIHLMQNIEGGDTHLPLLQAINDNALPAFADGGLAVGGSVNTTILSAVSVPAMRSLSRNDMQSLDRGGGVSIAMGDIHLSADGADPAQLARLQDAFQQSQRTLPAQVVAAVQDATSRLILRR